MPKAVETLPTEKGTLILDAAQRRFAAFGLNKVTMDEIAADLGMGKTSLYYYFPNKEELYKAVIKREQDEFLRRVRKIQHEDSSAADKLRRYVDHRLVYHAELVNLQVLSVSSWMQGKPFLRELFESVAEQELDFLRAVLRGGKRSGEFYVKSPDDMASLILHVLQGLRLRAAREFQFIDRHQDVPNEVEREMRPLVDLLIRALSSPPSY
jgi:TetR/AcrR family transcriptional regulator